MSVEVRGSAELLTFVPVKRRMKKIHSDAAGVTSSLQFPITSKQD